jgi:hypothetical protein
MFMEISPAELKSELRRNDAAPQPRVKRILYRRAFLVALLAAVVGCVPAATAQGDRPIITPADHRAPKKKDSSPRAVAVLQLAANGKASLLPIAILINGKFWDASAYKADPIPMALETGTVYEAERAGSTLGLFTVGSALHSNAPNAATPWLGTGAWRPGGGETATPPAKADTVPVGIDNSDEPPRLTKNPAAAKQPPPAGGSQPAPQPPSPQSAPQTSDPDAPPRLIKSTPPPSPAPEASPTVPPQTSPSPGTAAPAAGSTPSETKTGDAKPAEAKPDETPQAPTSDSGVNEATRPRLRRGKQVAPLPDDDIPGYSKVTAKSAKSITTADATASAAKPSAPTADNGPIQSIPAISDATGPEPRSFAFTFLKDEEGDRRKQMNDLAKEQVRAYIAARMKATITPASPPKPTGAQVKHTIAAKSPKVPDPILENARMSAYDVWNTNQPVLIFSAEAHLPPPPAGTAYSETASELRYSIMLVAYPDIYNNLHKLYVGITDKYHLDLTPRLDLIDAVDADGDTHAELLFKETSDSGTGWVIYRPTADKLWKMFDSLHPE